MAFQPQAGAVIFAIDLVRVSMFYQEVLGFEPQLTSQDYSLLHIPGFQLIIHSIPSVIADTISITDPPGLRTDSALKLIFFVPDIGSVRQAAMRFGGGLDLPESEWKYLGHRVCDGYDPEGNVFQLRENN